MGYTTTSRVNRSRILLTRIPLKLPSRIHGRPTLPRRKITKDQEPAKQPRLSSRSRYVETKSNDSIIAVADRFTNYLAYIFLTVDDVTSPGVRVMVGNGATPPVEDQGIPI
jgi:hypothetical protein